MPRNSTSALGYFMRVAFAGLCLASCEKEGGDPSAQIGANPALPAPQEYLVPPIQIAERTPWAGNSPTVPSGLQVKELAGDLKNPRALYVLPNGDILVVESAAPRRPSIVPRTSRCGS